MRTEKYCAGDWADRRAQVHSKRRRASRKEVTKRDTTVDHTTNSKTDIPNGEWFGYPPRVFTDPEYANTLPLTENDSEPEVTQSDFIGDYCDKCINKHNWWWCNNLDWEPDLLDVEPPTNSVNNKGPKQAQIRQPPPGWPKCKTKSTNKGNKGLVEEIPINSIVIKESHKKSLIICRSMVVFEVV